MGEFIVNHLRAPNDTSDAGPYLGRVGDELYIAWSGGGNRQLNIMPIQIRSDGSPEFDTGRKLILPKRCIGGPALCTAEVRGQMVLAWAMDHDELNSIVGISVDRNYHVMRDFVSFEWTDLSPAAIAWANATFIAWTGSNNNQLNIAPLVLDDSGWMVSSERKHVSVETSQYEPALAWLFGPYRLYIAWTGEDDALNVMYYQGGLLTDPPPYRVEFDRATKHTFSTETSDAGPALRVVGDSLSLVYRGSGNTNLNLLVVDRDDWSVMRKEISPQTTPHRPSICLFGDSTYIAWTGEDDHLNIGKINHL